jgi:hypothetical protein
LDCSLLVLLQEEVRDTLRATYVAVAARAEGEEGGARVSAEEEKIWERPGEEMRTAPRFY